MAPGPVKLIRNVNQLLTVQILFILNQYLFSRKSRSAPVEEVSIFIMKDMKRVKSLKITMLL